MSVFVCNLWDICSVYTHEHDIHHLLAETFMCIFSLELLQRSTMNSMDKNVLLYSWWEENSTYKWEVFALNGNKQSLSSFQIIGDYKMMGGWLSSLQFVVSMFHTVPEKESPIPIPVIMLNFLYWDKVSFIFASHNFHVHASLTWQFLISSFH